MNLSEKTRTRLAVLSAGLWFLTGIAALSLLGGPRGAIESYLKPIHDELGGWFGLTLGSVGFDDSPLPRYELAIEPRDFHAAELMGRNGSRTRDRWWFPARFIADGESFAVDLSFEETRARQPLLERSWKVQFRGKQRYRGMRELELLPARDLQHTVDIVVRDSARELGLLAPPGGFAALHINGAPAGPFFWSEGASTAMLERLGFPKGEVLTPRVSAPPPSALLVGGSADSVGLARYAPTIDPDDSDNPATERLTRLLAVTRKAGDEEFARELPELLDVEKFLTWNALICVYGDPEAEGFPQLSWYFDPVSGLLEPIVQNIDRPVLLPPAMVIEASVTTQLALRVLDVPRYRARRNEILWRLTSGESFDIAETSDVKLGAVLTQLAKTTGSLTDLNGLRAAADFRRTTRDTLSQRAAALNTVLATSQVETTPRLSVDAGTPTLTLEVTPDGLAEILLSELRFELGKAALANRKPAAIRVVDPAGGLRRTLAAEPVVIGSSVAIRPERVVVGSGAHSRRAAPWTVEIHLPFFASDAWQQAENFQAIDVVYRNAVTGAALPAAHLLDDDAPADRASDELRALFRPVEDVIAASGLPLQRHGDQLILPAGDHELHETLIVPRAYRLRIEAGARLRLGPDVSIISFRRISAEGTPSEPILLRPADRTRPWGVLAVARASEPSLLSFVTASGGSQAKFAGIEFDGQLSFNASDLVIRDSEVYDARDADGLSVKRASFDVSRTQFINNDADGLDSEWSLGVVSESLFVNNGDDGLDLADSDVSVDDSAFHWMGDKAISAGARSQVTVASTRLSDSEIAIASKEDSRVDVRNSEFRRNRLGFALYRDKPVFGGGSGTVTGGLFARNNRDFSVEPGSSLELIEVHREPPVPSDDLIGSIALRRVVTRFP